MEGSHSEIAVLRQGIIHEILTASNLWKNWLYDDETDVAITIRGFSQLDLQVPQRLWELSPELAEEFSLQIGEQLPLLAAMILSAKKLRSTNMYPNVFQRAKSFYAFLPRQCLNESGLLIDPSPSPSMLDSSTGPLPPGFDI